MRLRNRAIREKNQHTCNFPHQKILQLGTIRCSSLTIRGEKIDRTKDEQEREEQRLRWASEDGAGVSDLCKRCNRVLIDINIALLLRAGSIDQHQLLLLDLQTRPPALYRP